VLERVHHHERKAGHGDGDGEQNRKTHRHAGDRADFSAGDIRERAPLMSHRGKQNHHVMHGAADHRANQQPDRARQKTELRRQNRPHQRTRRCDGRKMVAKSHPFIHRHIILAVIERVGGRGAIAIQGQDFRSEKTAVEAISQHQNARRRDN